MKRSSPHQTYYSTSYSDTQTIDANERGIAIIKPHLGVVPFVKNQRVLDIACGTGLLGKLFSDNIYGFDLNTKAVRVAKTYGIKAKLNDAEKRWPYHNSFFDVVLASHIIEHVRDPDFLLTEAMRVLKPEGYLVVITPNLASWFNRILLLLGLQPFFTEVSTKDKTLGLSYLKPLIGDTTPVGHLRIFTHGSIKELIELHQFTIERTAGVEFGVFPWYLRFADQLISRFTPLASSLIVIAKKPSRTQRK